MTPSSRSDRRWRVRDRTLTFPDRTAVMGIVNVTPDSFYDGGRHAATEDAVRHGRRLAKAGADVLDVGGESTRPGAEPVPAADELERVRPVVEALAGETVVSVDTRKADVAAACLDAGADVVNDVSALSDPAMADVVAEADAGLVLMHMQGTPETMQDDPAYDDVVADVRSFLRDRVGTAVEAGVDREAICVDPGIGFGKTVEHNLVLLRRLPELAGLGRPILVGASRKSFLHRIGGPADPDDRLLESLGAAAFAAANGADVLRVHDVAETWRVLRVVDAIRGSTIARDEDA